MLLGAYQQLAVLQFGLPSLQVSVTFILIQSDLFKLKMHRQDVVEQMIMYVFERLHSKFMWAPNILYLIECSNL